MNSAHDLILDADELRKFINWLPDLERSETYYVSLLARRKYCSEENRGLVKSESEIRRTTCTKETMFRSIAQFECRRGAYDVPEESLAVYVTPNPRDQDRALRNLLMRCADAVCRGYRENMAMTLSEIHKAHGKKKFVSFDFDGPLPRNLSSAVNLDAVDVVQTRGGFHVLVRPADVVTGLKDSWWREIRQLPGFDVCKGDDMLPVPGCFQGGFIPRLLSADELVARLQDERKIADVCCYSCFAAGQATGDCKFAFKKECK